MLCGKDKEKLNFHVLEIFFYKLYYRYIIHNLLINILNNLYWTQKQNFGIRIML